MCGHHENLRLLVVLTSPLISQEDMYFQKKKGKTIIVETGSENFQLSGSTSGESPETKIIYNCSSHHLINNTSSSVPFVDFEKV